MSAQGVAQSVPQTFPVRRLANAGAQTWREGSKLWGELADGPYALSPVRDNLGAPVSGWELFWVGGVKTNVIAEFDDKGEGLRVMADLARQWRMQCQRVVYFIGHDLSIGQPVKIGYSARVEWRLRQLQNGCPHRLRVFATLEGDVEAEKRLHRRFHRSRLEGEWFRITPALKRLIEESV